MPERKKYDSKARRVCAKGASKLRLKSSTDAERSEGAAEILFCRNYRPRAGGLFLTKQGRPRKPTAKKATKRKAAKNGRNGLNAREAYDAGRDEGYNAAVYGEFEPGASRDDMMSEAYEIESNARQYAGHPTYEIESDAAWDAYERGVGVGIKKGLAERFPTPRKTKRAR